MGMDHTMWANPIELWNFLPANCERLDSDYIQSRDATPPIGIMMKLCHLLEDNLNDEEDGIDDEDDLKFIVLQNS